MSVDNSCRIVEYGIFLASFVPVCHPVQVSTHHGSIACGSFEGFWIAAADLQIPSYTEPRSCSF